MVALTMSIHPTFFFIVSKDAKYSETDFLDHEFFVRFLIQKRKTVIPDKKLARGIQSKSIRGLGVEPPVGVWVFFSECTTKVKYNIDHIS